MRHGGIKAPTSLSSMPIDKPSYSAAEGEHGVDIGEFELRFCMKGYLRDRVS